MCLRLRSLKPKTHWAFYSSLIPFSGFDRAADGDGVWPNKMGGVLSMSFPDATLDP